jgi:hypothetical protein
MHNPSYNWLKRQVKAWLRSPRLSPEDRAYYLRFLKELEMLRLSYEDAIQEYEALLVRNPEFPGDFVGRPDDDFTDYNGLDDEDDER